MDAADFFSHLRTLPPAATAVAVDDGVASGQVDLAYGALIERVEALAAQLRGEGVRVLATRLDNGVDWIVADLAALLAGIVHVPVPPFFSERQQWHVMIAAGVDALVAPPAGIPDPGAPAPLQRIDAQPVSMPAGTAKITFTSGSTGTPKGVCLDARTMLAVARAIAEATAALPVRRHLCALPLPILLENIAGLLAPLLRGATVVAPAIGCVGLSGSSTFNPARLDAFMRRSRCQSVVLLPQMLRAWTGWLRAAAATAPPSLLLAAVGGALVGSAAIAEARAVGLPAFEGYGLSEGASVQTLNLPWADRPGSAGRPLPHARMRIAADGEIEIGGALFLGYLGQPATGAGWWRTGDLGAIDDDGFVHVHGRKDAMLVTAFGRNVSPEWVEATLQAAGGIARAVVLGKGRPTLSAVLWPAAVDTSRNELAAAVARANAQLPDYARIGSWVPARHQFDETSGMATANGRPRRDAVAAAYPQALFDPEH